SRRTWIVLGFAANTCFTRDSCSRAIVLRSTSSLPLEAVGHWSHPALHSGWFPTTTIAASAWPASFAASAESDPSANRTFTPLPAASRTPSRMLTEYGGVPLYKSRSTWSIHGPITAIVFSLVLSSGRAFLSFFSNTIDSSVASRARALLESRSHGGSSPPDSLTIFAYGSVPDGSSSPSLK